LKFAPGTESGPVSGSETPTLIGLPLEDWSLVVPELLLLLPPQPAAVAARATTGSASSQRNLLGLHLPSLSIRT
jgi:hypothetical protein